MPRPTFHRGSPLLGRARELDQFARLIDQARAGRSGALVISGEAGIGKTVLVDQAVMRAGPDLTTERILASESEMQLPYAGVQLLCGHLKDGAAVLPEPQRQALEVAFGLRAAGAPNPLLVGLAMMGLLTHAGSGGLLCIIDDAQWLDDLSAHAVACMARRLSDEGLALVLVMRDVDDRFSDLPHLALSGLGDDDARTLVHRALAGPLDRRVLDQLVTEAHGNPLALLEFTAARHPAASAGGFALTGADPIPAPSTRAAASGPKTLAGRIEQSLLTELESLSAQTRMLLLLAAADPTGDVDLLRRAGARLGIGNDEIDAARHVGALIIGARVVFRHPLIRSAVYADATPAQRRAVHAALADATSPDRDPDRAAWHRAHAAAGPDEEVAAELEGAAERARARGGASAAAAFLERAALFSPEPSRRIDRLLVAADATHESGSPAAAVRLLDTARDELQSPRQEALAGRLRARADYALRRSRGAPRELLRAARDLEPYEPDLARDAYTEALAAAVFAGRLGEPGAAEEVARTILAATADPPVDRPLELLLRGQALLVAEGQAAAAPTVRRALRAYREQPLDALALHWMWLAGRAAQDIWDDEGMRTLAERQVRLARSGGVLTVLPAALNLQMVIRTFDGDLDAAEQICEDIDAILAVTGHPLPRYGRTFIAAYRGHVDEVERRAAELRADAYRRGEGYALTVANMTEALVYNGAGRYREALASARGELPYSTELGHAMRTLLELIEAAVRVDQHPLAEEALDRLDDVIAPVGEGDWAGAFRALAAAQVHPGAQADDLYREAVERFDRVPVPILRARSQLLYGEMLRRSNRRTDARVQLRAAYRTFSECGMTGFADRARRELRASGEVLRPQRRGGLEALTDQERSVAGLARDGLTNREIGARLFISAHTAEWHLRKVFVKLGIRSRVELAAVLGPGRPSVSGRDVTDAPTARS